MEFTSAKLGVKRDIAVELDNLASLPQPSGELHGVVTLVTEQEADGEQENELGVCEKFPLLINSLPT